MSLKNIAKIFTVLAISYILSAVLQQKVEFDYNYTKMTAKLNMFDGDEMSELAYKKLYSMLSGYAIVAEHFSVKRISKRLNANIYNGEICKRSENATKRNPRIQILDDLEVEINMIFTKTENAQRCAKEIKDYILDQKNKFFSEVEYYMELGRKENERMQAIKNEGSFNVEARGSIISINEEGKVSYKFSEVDINESEKEFLNLKLSNLFKTTVGISETSKMSTIFKLQYLFILIASILFLIMYNKEVVKKFDIIKNKLK